eukprot:TRINITY_DN2148_c1_g1_i1.p1 TRINITY_DN2148_c1_g1~~TRINITY_DN2148_c1_g1_i1.p1  ORF type:complete len:266 (+),score=49.25 TRINITY_DN2148_c1_g1_i1:93-890(+)
MAHRQNVGRDPDSFYVEDCRQVQGNTHAIQTLTGQISKLVGTLEVEKDFQHCRNMVDNAVALASETRTILMRIREHQKQAQNQAEKNNRRMMYQKLSDNLAITARVLEDVVKRFTAEERRHIASLEAQGMHSVDGCSGGLGFSGQLGTGNVATGSAQQFTFDAASCEQSLENDLQRERTKAMRKVDEDMRSLQSIYTDLAATAEEQRTTFDSLESHISSAAVDIERGKDQIFMTHDKHSPEAKRRFALGVAGAIGLFTLVSYVMS